MLPTFKNFQIVLIDKCENDYSYGDVIIFKKSNIKNSLIKRIVGLPGDQIQIKDGDIYVNDTRIETLNTQEFIEYAGIATSVVNLSVDEYFVLGDNYAESKDSRYSIIGCVKEEEIIGKVIN